jgi:ankyrin repeat protein
MNGQTECIEALVENGWNVLKQDSCGCNALHIAARFGYIETAKWLVNQGIDVMTRSKTGVTARWLAEVSGHKDIEKFLKCLGVSGCNSLLVIWMLYSVFSYRR